MHYGQSFMYKSSLYLNINHRSSFSQDCSVQSVHPEFHLEAFPHEYFSGMVLVKDFFFFKSIFLIYIRVLCKVVSRVFMSKGCSSTVWIQINPALSWSAPSFSKVMAETHSSQTVFEQQGINCATG